MFHSMRKWTIPTIERLESRVAPAVLDLPNVGGMLHYTTGPSNNTVTVDESLGNVYITDTDIIFLTLDAQLAGWTGHLQHVVSGPTNTFSWLKVQLGGGNDLIHAWSGWDSHTLIVNGGLGNDTISGGSTYDTFYGDEGDDQLYGGEGGDTLDGGSSNDRVEGNDGGDRLTGGTGNDSCYGGTGTDWIAETANEDMLLTHSSLNAAPRWETTCSAASNAPI